MLGGGYGANIKTNATYGAIPTANCAVCVQKDNVSEIQKGIGAMDPTIQNNHIFASLITILATPAVWAGPPTVCEALISAKQQYGIEWLRPDTSKGWTAYEALMEKAHRQILANNKNQYFDYVRELYRIDIDGDGKQENVVVVGQGSAHNEGVLVLDGSWRPKSYSTPAQSFEENDVCLGATQAIIKYADSFYVVDSCKKEMKQVFAYVNGEIRTACTFSYVINPTEEITLSENDGLCRKGAIGELDYIDFSESHRLEYGCFDSGGPECAHPLPSAARADIDNDGLPDAIVKMDVAWGGGAGCDFQSLDVLDKSRNSVANTEQAKLLRKATQKWGTCGGATSRPFLYKGQTYIENKFDEQRPMNYHNIVQLKHSKIDVVCEFSKKKRPVINRSGSP